MDKIIVVKRVDGGCNIVIPTPALFDVNSRDRKELSEKGILVNASDNEVLEWIKNKDAPDGRITELSNIPNDRTFRDAWTDDNDTETVDVDMEKARVVHMDNLRYLRVKKFISMGYPARPDSDIESELPNVIRDKLQLLRDIPQSYDLSVAKTPDELKLMVPDILK
jgi:hypothetical protein